MRLCLALSNGYCERRMRMQGYPPPPNPVPQQTYGQNTSSVPPAPDYTPTSPPPLPATPVGMPAGAPTWNPGVQNQPSTPKSNRNKLLIGGGIGCGVLLVLCTCVGLLGAAASLGSSSSASNGSPTATTQAQIQIETPTATATTDPNAGSAAYISVVTSDSSTLGDDLTKVGTDCDSNKSLSGCRAALVVVREDSQSYLDDLDANPAPPCLASVDKPLRAGLNDVHAATQTVIDGIDTLDTSKVQDGTALMNKATTEINAANSAFGKASCP
jgi:hypothetical protein